MKFTIPFKKAAIFTFYLTGLVNSTSFGHSCVYPDITFDTLSPGVVQKISCFKEGGFGSCFDTVIYKESELLSELHTNFTKKKFAIMGRFASVTRKLRLDTTFYDTSVIIPAGGIKYDVNNYMDETITLEVDKVIKGQFEKQRLVFPHTWFYNEESTLVAKWDTLLDSTSYDPAQGGQFLSFFDKYDSIKHLGFAPTVDCFFVVSGYFVEGNRIRKKGEKGAHGISVSLEGFMENLSIKNQFSFRNPRRPYRYRLYAIFDPLGMHDTELYNLMGRRRHLLSKSSKNNVVGTFEPGIYFLK